MSSIAEKRRLAILISGRGSNMIALADAARDPDCPFEIAGVLSNVPDAAGLSAAVLHGIPTASIASAQYPDRGAFEEAVDTQLNAWNAELVCLAGFMRKLTPLLVDRWKNRMINIHPSLLPAFKGLKTHEKALKAGVQVAGCTVHMVRPELDDGPILAQGLVPVLPEDQPESLAARVLEVEHPLLVGTLWALASGAVTISGDTVIGAGPRLLLHPMMSGTEAE